MALLRLGLCLLCALTLALSLTGIRAWANEASPDPEVVHFIGGELAPDSSVPGDDGIVGEETEPEEEEPLQEDTASEVPDEKDDVTSTEEEPAAEPVYSEDVSVEPEQEVSEGLAVLEDQGPERVAEQPSEEEAKRFFGPMPTKNQHPLHLMFYNFPAERAQVLPDGEREFVFRFEGSSNMVKKAESGTIVDLDLESWNYTLEYQQGTPWGELSVQVPLRDSTHGFMDNIIDSWHDLLGLPRGDRPDYPANEYHFFVRSGDGGVLNFPSDRLGIADVSLAWKGEITSSCRGTLAYRAAVKLPTGNPSDGLGSGGTDFGVGLAYEKLWHRWAGYANLNYVIIGNPDLAGFEANNIWTGSVACEYRLRPTWWLTGQMNFAQYPLSTGTGTLDRDSNELLFGFHKLLGKRLLFSGGFTEDMRTDTAPDFGIIGELRWRF